MADLYVQVVHSSFYSDIIEGIATTLSTSVL